MKKSFTIFILIILISPNAISQKIIRQSLSCLGASNFSNNFFLQQTIGQSSNTTVFYNEKSCVRQGFLQSSNETARDFSNPSVDIAVYPNPSHDNFTIRIRGNDNTYILFVTDVLGKNIFISEISENHEQIINSREWGKGVYFISIYFGEKLKASKKIIKTE